MFVPIVCLLILAAGQIRIGDLAPDFELPDINMKMHKLSEYSGNIVLAFFPAG